MKVNSILKFNALIFLVLGLFSCQQNSLPLPTDTVVLSVGISDQNGQQIPNSNARLSVGNSTNTLNYINNIYIDTVLSNTIFTFEVHIFSPSNCPENPVFTMDIGPFFEDTILSPITLDLTALFNPIEVTGTVLDCFYQPVSNGYVKIEYQNQNHIVNLDATGEFSFTDLDCGLGNDIIVTAYNVDNSAITEPVNLPVALPVTNYGTINCLKHNEYINLDLFGEQRQFVDVYNQYLSLNQVQINGTIDPGFEIRFTTNNSIGSHPVTNFFLQYGFDDFSSASIANLNLDISEAALATGDTLRGILSGDVLFGDIQNPDTVANILAEVKIAY